MRAANQFQFRRKPIHSLVEITGNHNSIKLPSTKPKPFVAT